VVRESIQAASGPFLFAFSQLPVEADSSPFWLELTIHNAPHALALRSSTRQLVSARF
jgi:hypothetical protein